MSRAPVPEAAAPRRLRLLLAIALSTLVWSGFMWSTRKANTVVLNEQNSDHYSHFGAAALAMQRGSAIYRGPVLDLCLTPKSQDDPLLPAIYETVEALGIGPGAVCFSDAPERGPPLMINWMNFPRPYPPGNVLVFAPIGLAYAHLGLSFEAACGLTVALIIFFGHLALLALAYAMRLEDPEQRTSAAWFAFAICALFIMGWTFAGFYDPLAIALLLVAGRNWIDERPARALGAFGLACFFHFRALWFLPLGLAATVTVLRTWRAGTLDGSQKKWALVGLFAGALAALALSWVQPFLDGFPVNHPLHRSYLGQASAGRLALLAALFIACGAVASRGARMLGACAAWSLVMIVVAPQAMPWHAISLVALVALVPATQPRTRLVWLMALVLALEIATRFAFGSTLVPGWLVPLFGRL